MESPRLAKRNQKRPASQAIIVKKDNKIITNNMLSLASNNFPAGEG